MTCGGTAEAIREVEVDALKYKIRGLEAELLRTQLELEEKRRSCVALLVELRRTSVKSRPGHVVPIPELKTDRFDKLSIGSDDLTLEILRVDFLSTLDENNSLKARNAELQEQLKSERSMRLRDAKKHMDAMDQKRNEVENYLSLANKQSARTAELEDELAAAKTRTELPQLTAPSSTVTSRSFSPPPVYQAVNDATAFSRNYIGHRPSMTFSSVPVLPPLQSFNTFPVHSTYPTYAQMISRQSPQPYITQTYMRSTPTINRS